MSYWASVLTPLAVDAIAVVGLYVVVNSGRLSVGHAVFVCLGSYAAAVGVLRLGLPAPVVIASAVILPAIVGLLFALVVEGLEHWFYAIATLAFTQVVVGVISLMDLLGGPIGLYGVPVRVNVYTAIAALGIAVLLVVAWDRSVWGRETRAVRDSVLASETLGLNARLIHARAFVFGSAIAGLSGALRVEYLGIVSPADASFERSLLFLVYLMIGGRDFILGALVGTFGLGVLPELLRFVGEYRLEIYGALVALVMIFNPKGLLASLGDATRRRRPRSVAA